MPLAGSPLNESISLLRLLERGLALHADEPAIASAAHRMTWRELDAAASRYARSLLTLGLKPGDRVASLMPNRIALVIHYLGCNRAGLIAVPLNYRYRPPEIDHALSVCEASILLHHAERQEDIEASRLAGSLPRGTITYDHNGGDDGRPAFEELAHRPESPDTISLPEVNPDAPAFIFFTSGSTGKPKGVTHTHRTFGWMLASTAGAFEFICDDIVLPGSSYSHLGGCLFSLAALSQGARVVLARVFDAHEMLPLLAAHKPTVMMMLPSALMRLIRDHGAHHEHFGSLRLCRCGGDKVPHELEEEFHDLTGLVIDEGYGMTEIGIATLGPPHGPIRIGSVGTPNPGFVLSIRDEEGNELPPNTEGRLWARSNSVTAGYWNRPDATAQAIVDGWMDTGDMMRADESGNLWFRGRKKQIIVHDGSNICPQEVEESLLDHPAVAAAGAVGIHDLVHGENVWAYVTLKPDADAPKAQELIDFSRQLVGYKAPEHIQFLDEMPLNATGKTDRVTLKKMAAERMQGHVGETPQLSS